MDVVQIDHTPMDTLSASVIHANELPEALASRLPRYPPVPVTLLGRLAVDVTLNGKGGTFAGFELQTGESLRFKHHAEDRRTSKGR